MARIDLPYVQRFRDRFGRVRHYFRRRGYGLVTLPGEPGSVAFMDAYGRALGTAPKSAGVASVKPGSISALLSAYYQSGEFKALKDTTQGNYRNILDRFRDKMVGGQKIGDWPVKAMRRTDVIALRDSMSDTPGAARNFIKRLRKVLEFAVDREWIESSPAANVKPPMTARGGFRAWDDADIEAFEKRWPAGSRARLALYLLLYTGQRRSDVVGMGRQHIRNGRIRVIQQKRGLGQEAVRLWIKVHPTLQTELDLTPKDNLTFLMTAYGKPMSHAGFSGWFVQCAIKAGLPERSSPHGLRKAAGRRLAEAGCSAKEISAILGHRTLSESARYTESADQKTLADAAIGRLSDIG